jgi:hypothetical protein
MARPSRTGHAHARKPFPTRTSLVWNTMKSLTKCAMVTFALATLPEAALARTELNCVTTKVIIRTAPGEDISARTVEYMNFLIDDAAKALAFADGRPLRVKRFDDYWISAEGDDIQYEFNRSDGTLTYAGSMVEDNTAVTIVGSGRCEPHRLPLLR